MMFEFGLLDGSKEKIEGQIGMKGEESIVELNQIIMLEECRQTMNDDAYRTS